MISAETANFVIALVSMVFVYLASITCIGAIQAWVSARLGDESAVEAGYLSFNPAVYYDTLGFISLLVFGFGWSRTFPFHPDSLTNPFKKLKIFCVYLVQPLAATILALIAIVTSTVIIGPHALLIVYHYTSIHSIFRSLNMQVLTEMCGASAPLLVVLVLLISTAAINIFLTAWSIVNSIWDHTLYLGTTRNYRWMQHAEWISLAAPLCLFIFLFPVVHFFMLNTIIKASYFIVESVKLL